MRTTFDFAPLWRSTVGFDHLFDLIDTSLKQAADDAHPPYNIERSGEDAYRITLAVAGFGRDDVSITAEQNTLIIEGNKADQASGEYLYRGIASRAFRRIFKLADHVQVKGAHLQDGILTVDLVREVPEAMKPRRIAINAGEAAPQLDRKKAA